MKVSRLIITTFVSLYLINIFSSSPVTAQDGFGEFPYEGTYITEEDNAFRGFIFDAEEQAITVLVQGTTNQASMNRFNEFRNQRLNNTALTAMIDPELSAEEINAIREESGLDEIDYSELLLEAADKVEPSMTDAEALTLVLKEVPGVHFLTTIFGGDILISKPEIKQSQELWLVGVLNEPRVLRFEMGDSTDTITDEYGVVYNLVEEGDQSE